MTGTVIEMSPQVSMFSSEEKADKGSVLDEKYFGKKKRRHIEEFACVFSIIFCIIGGVRAYNGAPETAIPLLGATGLLIVLGYYLPIVLYPFWSAWMTFAHYLGIVMTFLFVSVTWVVMAVPLAFLLRLIGTRVMDLSYGEDVNTYWEERPAKSHNFKLLERQF